MRLAVPSWQGRVSPVFDVAEHVLLVDLADGQEQGRAVETLGKLGLHDRARRLVEWKIDVLVCGALSRPLELLLGAGGIRVIPLMCGDVDEVVRAYREGTLEDERFVMPGCCHVRQRGRRRRRRGHQERGLEELE